MVGRGAYNLMYRFHAPWESGPRDELVELVTTGPLTPEILAPGRAVDLGCGSGANAIFLAEHGFDVTGVDFSAVGLAKARRAAEVKGAQQPASLSITFVEADLTAPVILDVTGPFDLLVDYGTLDDLPRARRPAMADTVRRLSRPGSVFLLWCFYDEIAWWRRRGARFPGLAPGEEQDLFAADFDIVRHARPAAGSGFACFLLTRRRGGV
jgi:SAM-dependent methyltransferase